MLQRTGLGITYCNRVYAHDIITIGHDQTAKFYFTNILVSRLSDKITQFFAHQYFYVYGILCVDLCHPYIESLPTP